MTYKKVVIIGAPRSGTNMLRDILCTFKGIGTWPCDEINYIWRHGNLNYDSDEFTVEMATPIVKKYIARQVDKLANKEKLDFVVEKTCANSLRVSFVNEVLPDAYYIFIVRNGLDVVASANLRWTAKLDIPYLLKKVKYVPLTDLPFYAIRYLWSHLYRKLSGEKRLAFWGPQLNNMKQLLKQNTLNQICAIQWKTCVEASERALNDIPNSRVHKIKYELFVTQPNKELKHIFNKLGISVSEKEIDMAVKKVSNKSVGKWRGQLDNSILSEINPIINKTMIANGYDDTTL